MQRQICAVLLAMASLGVPQDAQAQSEFPYGRELILDARPMRGGKRVPILEIASDGRGTLDLWCSSAQVQAIVVNDTITLLLGDMREQSCPQERILADQDLAMALAEITNWHMEGSAVVLTGAKTLRFRPATN